MSADKAQVGLNCPNCGGMVPIPEGQLIVICPFCDLRSFVRGERGVRRYQIEQVVSREQAIKTMQRFLSSNFAIARDAASKAHLSESFLVYLPFWMAWARVAGWVFGKKRVGSGDKARYEPREVRILDEITWNGAACEVGEFGVTQVPLGSQPLLPFTPSALHATGLVFEPVGSASEAHAAAESLFEKKISQRSGITRISQIFLRTFRKQFNIVYYPLWVLRYLYRGRAFQVVVDGHQGQVLYGKAPGNTLYRAGMLVAGMALGAFLSVDVSALMLFSMRGDEDTFWLALAAFVIGLVIMGMAYRAFRYGEQYEYRQGKPALPVELKELANPLEFSEKVQDLEKWISRLS